MQSRKFLGRNELVNRLALQVGSMDMAVRILKRRGQLTSSGQLTELGASRNSMTAEERSIDRASARSGRGKNEYIYNSITNSATLKNK